MSIILSRRSMLRFGASGLAGAGFLTVPRLSLAAEIRQEAEDRALQFLYWKQVAHRDGERLQGCAGDGAL